MGRTHHQYSKIILCILGFVSPSVQFTHYEDGTCNIIGDPDVYGIGVRISYYLSFFAAIGSVIAGNKKATRDCVKGVNIVTLAMLIILIRNATEGSFSVFEWLITFPLITLPTMSIIPLFLSTDGESSNSDNLKVGFFAMTYTIASGVQPYLFWTLMEQGKVEGCEPRVFVFAYFDFYNPHFVKFTKAMAIIACVFGLFYLCLSMYSIYVGLVIPKRVLQARAAERHEEAIEVMLRYSQEAGENLDRQAIENHIKKLKRLGGIYFGSIIGASGIISIACIEMILKGNNVDLSDATLGSTSQLIPFLIGMFTFISTVYTCIKDRIDHADIVQS